jgi:hypothetical protein
MKGKMMRIGISLLAAGALLAGGSAATAGNRLIEANTQVQVAGSAYGVTPARTWNKLGARPGRGSEVWTLDGPALNEITFYGAIATDRPLFREVNRRERPLPHFSSTMLLTDIPTLLENSYRAGRGVTVYSTDRMEPTRFGGRDGVRFEYSFTTDDEVRRRGEGYGAIVNGQLYLITYEAPVIHYFDGALEAYRQVVSNTTIRAAR